MLHFFYLFQIVSIVIWSLDDYFFYAACIAIISGISISSKTDSTSFLASMSMTSFYTAQLRETRSQSQSLHDMVSHNADTTVWVRARPGLDLEAEQV